MLAILILAAGASSRMEGRDKLTLPIDGMPMLATMILRAERTRAPVMVALPPNNPARAAIVADCDAAPVTVRDAHLGMGASIATGTQLRPKGCTALMILPADMPTLEADDLIAMKEAWAKAPATAILRATGEDGTPGHPVIFPAACFDALEALSGDLGAREVIARHAGPVLDIALPGRHALLDIDTPEHWRGFLAGSRS
jgi:CTP:molybdopterin cytidylyltransferase MocA